MSLKIVNVPGKPNLYIRGTLFKKSYYESTGTGDPDVAEQILIKRAQEISREHVHGKSATRTFADAAASYLKDEPRTASTAEKVRKLLVHFGDTALGKIGEDSLERAFKAILRDGTNAATATKVRAVIVPLRAILEHGATLGWCARPSFKKRRIPKTVTNFLLPAQADALIAAASPHLRPLLTFLIGTGCRMSEAIELEWSNVDLRGCRARVWQKQGNERRVELPPRVIAALTTIPFIGQRQGHVFRSAPRINHHGVIVKLGEPYRPTGDQGGGQIKTGWATACRNAGLPGKWRAWVPKGAKTEKRQWVPDLTPHDMRHTWASWYACVHQNPFKLKQEGGWSSLSMVENYAHMMPDAYRDDILAWWAGATAEVRRQA
jgi:integrase